MMILLQLELWLLICVCQPLGVILTILALLYFSAGWIIGGIQAYLEKRQMRNWGKHYVVTKEDLLKIEKEEEKQDDKS